MIGAARDENWEGEPPFVQSNGSDGASPLPDSRIFALPMPPQSGATKDEIDFLVGRLVSQAAVDGARRGEGVRSPFGGTARPTNFAYFRIS